MIAIDGTRFAMQMHAVTSKGKEVTCQERSLLYQGRSLTVAVQKLRRRCAEMLRRDPALELHRRCAQPRYWFLACAINCATREPGFTGSTSTIMEAFRIMRSGECHSLPRFTRMLETCLVCGSCALCT